MGKDPHSLSGNPLRTGYQGARGQLGKRNERQRPVSSFPHSIDPGGRSEQETAESRPPAGRAALGRLAGAGLGGDGE